MKRALQVLLLTSAMAFVFQTNEVKAQRPTYQLHSMLIFNFIKYIEWPAEAKSGDFIIAVYGDDDVFEELNKLYGGKSVKGQSVKVVNINKAVELNEAHLIYLADNKSNDFDEVLAVASGKPTLLITDRNGLGEKGSNINFKTVGGKLKFEINQAAFDKNSLKVSSQLVSMAIVI
ncbi:MAG: hypothetical protein ACJAT1_001448 [Marivirga sp.]|jgi:hypothetical protein